MKFIIVFAAVIAAAVAAAVPGTTSDVTVLRQLETQNPDGSFQWSFETSDGASQQQAGSLRTIKGAEAPALVVSGEYQHTGPDNVKYVVKYTADENGFHPEGAHLPVA